MTDVMGNVSSPRDEIDAIDLEILELLNRRAVIALRVGAAKAEADRSLCDPKRESEVIEALKKQNKGPLDSRSVEIIFQRIIEESLQLQQRTYQTNIHIKDSGEGLKQIAKGARVAFQGAIGSFSDQAARAITSGEYNPVPTSSFEELFDSIDAGRADLILSPLENSLVGSVHRCYDLLLSGSFSIIGEIVLPVAHYLVGSKGSRFETIKSVESHPVALAQCERFIAAYPSLEVIAGIDTAESIKRVSESGDLTRAAIGSKVAADLYGGVILREHLEDDPENYTRFALLSPEAPRSEEGTKISLIVRLKHQPGALHSALRPFVRRGINLVKIESRPIKGAPGDFNFYFDLLAPVNASELESALDEIEEQAREVIFLGRYSTVEVKK